MTTGVPQDVALQALEDALGLERGAGAQDYITNNLYVPDTRIAERVEAINSELGSGRLTPKRRQQLGYDLEDLALLAFNSLSGRNALKSYASAGAQLDLVVDGGGVGWRLLWQELPGARGGTGILVEAKATAAPVGVTEFERLASLLTGQFANTAGLGVILSLNGASGFPRPGDGRTQCVRHARVSQLWAYARHAKPIVLLDRFDLPLLAQKGGLVRLLKRKVVEIEEMTGKRTSCTPLIEADLPARMRELMGTPPRAGTPRRPRRTTRRRARP